VRKGACGRARAACRACNKQRGESGQRALGLSPHPIQTRRAPKPAQASRPLPRHPRTTPPFRARARKAHAMAAASLPPRRRAPCLVAAAAGPALRRSVTLRAPSPPPASLRAASCVASAAAAGDHAVREATPADAAALLAVEVACRNPAWGELAIKVRKRGGRGRETAERFRPFSHARPSLSPPQHELNSALATVLLAEAPASDGEGDSAADENADPACSSSTSCRGLAIVWTVADEAQLLELAVTPSWRRRGVGAALVAAVLATAPAGGRVVLEVEATNDAAIALYTSFGFERVGGRKGYYGLGRGDAVLMARPAGGAVAGAA